VVFSLLVLDTITFIYAVAWPFSCWAPSTIVVSGGFPVLCAGYPCVLLVELTSMDNVIGPYYSSTTGISSMGSAKGEGIASIPMNSSGCLVSYLASTASYGAQLLWVFLPSWLDASIFGAVIVATG
jgi:hypothetical protein